MKLLSPQPIINVPQSPAAALASTTVRRSSSTPHPGTMDTQICRSLYHNTVIPARRAVSTSEGKFCTDLLEPVAQICGRTIPLFGSHEVDTKEDDVITRSTAISRQERC